MTLMTKNLIYQRQKPYGGMGHFQLTSADKRELFYCTLPGPKFEHLSLSRYHQYLSLVQNIINPSESGRNMQDLSIYYQKPLNIHL